MEDRKPNCLGSKPPVKPSPIFGGIDRRGQANLPNLRRSDTHEGGSVKTRARRDRDFPNMHSASPALAERHET
jgi:hypothetical protein